MTEKSQSMPDFLGIGAHKGGSTWLYAMLKKHPGVWMPPTKELHYFDRSPEYGSPSHLGIGGSPIHRLVKSREYRKVVAKAVVEFAQQPSLERLRWDLRYLTGTPDDRWYCSLFEPGRGKLTGDITPAYSMLSATDVAKVHALLPDARVIFLIRNPVDRAWSAFQYGKKFKGRAMSSIGPEELVAVTEQEWFVQRADYLRTMDAWRGCYPESQFLVGYFDEILEDPQALLTRIFAFLGLESPVDLSGWGLEKRVNASKTEHMPPEVRRRLAEKYHPMTQELSRRLGSYATRWLDDIESYLAAPQAKS